MFTVFFSLIAALVFALTLVFTKFNFKKAFVNALVTVGLGLLIDLIIGTYFVSLANLIY